ncbi:uncharacterized protein Bfra_004625 [Botrytis fragariae]|uniref:Uncharacterized protein n=1 Tax=Botrytis fragariae TaxID=1964551 RepID=A0A8H6AVM9_9HELO|nr:uncharacterized protein Bfra_004625 [Botrytis fragariae]KAF5874613.1 hypothetical protein Bfra_004625 [Botrytis fragariae]
MFDSVLTPPPITNATDLEEPNWSKEQPPSYTSSGSYLTGTDKFEDLHLDDPKDTNDDVCKEAERASTGWANASEVIIPPPSQAYFTGVKSQAAVIRAPLLESQWSQEQTLPVYQPYQIGQTRLEEASPQSDAEATQSSTWWSARWSTTWAQAFGETISPPNPVHFPLDQPHNHTSSGNLNRNTSLTGRNPHKGFHQTKKLLGNQLMNRITYMNGNTHTSIRYYEDLTPDRRNTYEQAAGSFIDCAKNLILQSEGPNQRVDDWMIMGFIDKKYTVPEEGEKKPYLFGEWEYLWAIDKDEIAEARNSMLEKVLRAGKSWRDGWTWYRIPTVEDWKWWCGEWRKVPGAIREWKPAEEVWPWQRRFWAEVLSLEAKCEF